MDKAKFACTRLIERKYRDILIRQIHWRVSIVDAKTTNPSDAARNPKSARQWKDKGVKGYRFELPGASRTTRQSPVAPSFAMLARCTRICGSLNRTWNFSFWFHAIVNLIEIVTGIANLFRDLRKIPHWSVSEWPSLHSAYRTPTSLPKTISIRTSSTKALWGKRTCIPLYISTQNCASFGPGTGKRWLRAERRASEKE